MHAVPGAILYVMVLDPAYIIAALFLAGMGIICTLQMRHHRRIEKVLEELHGLRDLKEEIVSLKQGLKAVDMEKIMAMLDEVREGSARLEQKIGMPYPQKVEVERGGGGRDLYLEIEQQLTFRRFQRITILAEFPSSPEALEGEFQVPVEAHRDGVVYKGHVIVRDGSFVSEQMEAAYKAFP